MLLAALVGAPSAPAAPIGYPVLDEAPGAVERGDTVSITFDAGPASECALGFRGPDDLATAPLSQSGTGGEQRVGWRVPPRAARGRWHGELTCSGPPETAGVTEFSVRLVGRSRDGRHATLVQRGSVQWRSLAPPSETAADPVAGTPAGGDLAGTYPDPVIRPHAITAAMLSSEGTKPGQILLSDGGAVSWAFPPFQPRLERTFVVSGSDLPAVNGARLVETLEGIDAGPTNPALMLLEPGIYDVGSDGVAMKPFVDIEGSGEGVTRIIGPAHADPEAGTVLGADDAELRLLSVESTGGGPIATAIRNSGASPTLSNVTAAAYGSPTAKAIVSSGGAAPLIRDSTVRVAGDPAGAATGIESSAAPARLERVDVEVSGAMVSLGVNVSASTPLRILDSAISASAAAGEPSTALRVVDASIVLVDRSRLTGDNAVDGKSNSQVRIGASQLEGTATFTPSSSSSRCVFSYSAAYTPLSAGCG